MPAIKTLPFLLLLSIPLLAGGCAVAADDEADPEGCVTLCQDEHTACDIACEEDAACKVTCQNELTACTTACG